MGLRKYCFRYIGFVLFVVLVHYLGLHLSMERLSGNMPVQEEKGGLSGDKSHQPPGHALLRANNRILVESVSSRKVHWDENGAINAARFPLSNSFHQFTEEDAGLTGAGRQFSCSSIVNIVLQKKLKQTACCDVHEGLYQGKKYLIKLAVHKQNHTQECLRQTPSSATVTDTQANLISSCSSTNNNKLMTDILMSLQVAHANLLPLLGFCVRGTTYSGSGPDLINHSPVIAVYAYGTRLDINELISWSLYERFHTAVQLLHLLTYLQHSPIGNLLIKSLSRTDFLIRDKRVFFSDLSKLSADNLACNLEERVVNNSVVTISSCAYGISCTDGVCPGYNNVQNLFHLKAILLQRLLRTRNVDLNRKLRKLWIQIETNPLIYDAQLVSQKLQTIYKETVT